MKFNHHTVTIYLSTAFLIASTFESAAFSLLGPIQPWMQMTNGVFSIGDIGGPMCISNAYRWNVPVVTYGFDQSFLNYFGSNGVAAVESAIQILNELPLASQLVLTNYPRNSEAMNYAADAQSLYDLKSVTLSLLLEQMGLGQPTRNIFVLKQWNPLFISDPYEGQWPEGTIPNYIVQRNFDPQTLNANSYVNGSLYSAHVASQNNQNSIISIPVDPLRFTTAVADFNLESGGFYTGLTYDDAGGLAYLLSTNNVNYETLLSGVVGAGTNANSFVNGAWRPGMDKMTFIPQPVDSESGSFLPITNYFNDSYITNGIWQQQMVRIISQPDFLFSAGDVTLGIPTIPFYSRTGSTNWLNDAVANGNTNNAGPGVIQPQVQIIFNKLGRKLVSDGSISDEQVFDESQFWSSFDSSTNAPVVYPITQTGTNQLTVRMWLQFVERIQESYVWQPSSLSSARFAMQTSTNRMNWTTLFTVTNSGSVCTYFNENPASAVRFYRLIPQ
jgi:hypothetical protein